MTIVFSAIIYDIDYDTLVHDCAQQWRTQGVTHAFLRDHPGGASWGCEVCENVSLYNTSMPSESIIAVGGNPAMGAALAEQRCLVCDGYPTGHPECAGVAFAQNFPDIVNAMWFTFVTVTYARASKTPTTH